MIKAKKKYFEVSYTCKEDLTDDFEEVTDNLCRIFKDYGWNMDELQEIMQNAIKRYSKAKNHEC